MDKKQYEQFQKSIKECQERSQRTLASIDDTLLGVRQTLKDIAETNDNIDKIKNEYNKVMEKLSEKIAKSFTLCQQPFMKKQGVFYQDLPQQLPEEVVAKRILSHKSILIITGAGVSADSGIPTFRGKGGLYSKNFTYKQKQYSPQQFITLRNFTEEPQGIWNWIDYIYKMSCNSVPNQTHRKIHKMAQILLQKNKQVVLATQNIDDLHIKPKENQYQYYNIHGNCKKLRCSQHHFTPYSVEARKQKCSVCGEALRPHVLFFDESYGLNYGGQIKQKQFQLVISIGTSAKTGMIINMLQRAQQIVQINPEPVLQVGKVYRFTQNTNQILNKLNEALSMIQIIDLSS